MPMDLPTMRTRVRRDLRDEDSGQYRWTDAALDRHIARAVHEVSLAAPREAAATLTTTAGSRDLSTTTLTSRVAIEAVEYPTGQYPPAYVPFTTWGDTLTLLIDSAPLQDEEVRVRYAQLHTLDATSTTMPDALHDVVATGAAAYAALEWSSYATNRVNVGGAETWRNYHTWAQERMASFAKQLAKYSRERRLRARVLYGALARPVGPR
jgi:hypothetical protein